MAEDRAALVARLRGLEQTCKAQADAYEGDYLAWLERAEAAHHAIAALATPPETPSEPSAIVASGLVETVREWQEARRPAQLTEPGVDLALTYQAAVKRMTAADEALAAYDLSGPSAPTPVESVDLRIGDVVMFGGRLEPPRFSQLTTDYECRRDRFRLVCYQRVERGRVLPLRRTQR